MAKRSRKSMEHYRRRRVADLKHALRCIHGARLPDSDRGRQQYIEIALTSPELPPRKEVSARLQLLDAEREACKIYTIDPVDMTKAQLSERRKQKDRERKVRARRKSGAMSRPAYLAAVTTGQPWIAAGISKATYYRLKTKNETGPSEPHNAPNETGPSGGETGPSAASITTTADEPVSPSPVPPHIGRQDKTGLNAVLPPNRQR